MDPESKLAAYRAKKKREAQINSVKDKIYTLFTFSKHEIAPLSSDEEVLLDQTINNEAEHTEDVQVEPGKQSATFRERGLQAVILVLWMILYIIFIKLEFGIIYLIVSALFGMYYNTRTGPRNASEVSAYSVFNKNCESIDGTLKAEQFEREIRYGPQSVH